MREADKLYYHATESEVRLGDRVRITRFLRKPLYGVVAYLPGISKPHPEMKWEDGIENWAIRLDSGDLIAWIYLPEEVQPSKKIELLHRDHPGHAELMETEMFQ